MSTTTSKKAKTVATPKAAKRSGALRSKAASVAPATPPKTAPVSPVTGSAPKPAPSAKPAVVDAPKSVILGPELRKKELIDDVVARSGVKKKDAKPVVEATLAALGEALTAKRELILPPMGKLKVRREKDMPKARVLTAKIRQPKSR